MGKSQIARIVAETLGSELQTASEMRKMHNILWSDKLLSKKSFTNFRLLFIKHCLDQERRQGSRLLERMILRRTIYAIVKPGSKER